MPPRPSASEPYESSRFEPLPLRTPRPLPGGLRREPARPLLRPGEEVESESETSWPSKPRRRPVDAEPEGLEGDWPR